MITIIVLAIIGFSASLIYMYRDLGFDNIGDFILSLLTSILMALGGGLLGFVIASFMPMKTEIIKTTYNLECLQDNGATKGKFYLGSGQIDGSMKYVFYYEENGFYQLHQVDYYKAKIKYSDENAKAEKYDEVPCKKAFINYFAIDVDFQQYYIIYVPKGTIKQNYNLDAQ